MLWTLQKGLSITSSQWLYLITKKKNQIGRNKYSFEREREREQHIDLTVNLSYWVFMISKEN